MKIKQIGQHNGDIIETILNNRNIPNLKLFLNPNNENDSNPFDLSNMAKGLEVVISHLKVGNKVGILVDCDADGFSSSTIIYSYIKRVFPDSNLIYFLHDGKTHGLTENIVDQISETDIDLIIVPDAGSNDSLAISHLVYSGVDVVIIDHHEVENEPVAGVLINNQLEHNIKANKNLVGAGMTFKFCQAMDEILGNNYSDDFYDLVAIGQIGDSSDISENEVRNMVFKGLNNLQNPFVLEILKDHFGEIKNLAPLDFSFSIIPLINSVVRVGTMEEKDLLFRALNSIGADETWTVTKKKKNKTTGKFDKFEVVQNLYEYTRDSCKKVKARQASLVKKVMASLTDNLDTSSGIIIGILEPSEQGSITGLVANKISSKYQKPSLLLHYDEVENRFLGSGRGYEKVLPSLKDWCNDTELVEFAQGHANAFGISIPGGNFSDFKSKTTKLERKDVVYEVDLIIPEKVSKKEILEIEDNKYLFGGKVREPLLAFTGIKVNKNFIRQRGSMLTFFDAGVEFVMYGAPEGLFEELTYNFDPYITMDFVGRASVSKYSGKVTPQLILEDCQRNEEVVPNEQPPTPLIEEVTIDNIVF